MYCCCRCCWSDSMSSIQTSSICSNVIRSTSISCICNGGKQIEFLQSPIDRKQFENGRHTMWMKKGNKYTHTKTNKHACSKHTHSLNNSTINLCVWPHCRWASRFEIKGIQKPFRALWKMSCWVLINRYSYTITLVVVRCFFFSFNFSCAETA